MHRTLTSVLCICVAVEAATAPLAAVGQHTLSTSEEDGQAIIKLVQAAENEYLYVHSRYASFGELVDSGQLAKTAERSSETLRLYHELDLSSGSAISVGFALGMVVSTDGRGYKISVIDTRDRCGFSLFSDESGIVYTGTTMTCGSEESVRASGRELRDANRRPLLPNGSETCPLSDILNGAAKNAQQLADDLQRFTAEERVEELERKEGGKRRRASDSIFEYVAQIEVISGMPSVDEYRTSVNTAQHSQGQIFDKGTAAFALLFHPKHIVDFAVTCEGQTEVQSRTTWLLNFSQQPSRGNMFHIYRSGGKIFPVKLKGRAWISAENYQVLRLESDLIEPIYPIHLQKEHSHIEYAPVEFPTHNVQLWLPQLADLEIDLRGHHYERRHTFSHFQLFSVDTGEQVKGLKGAAR